MVKTIALLIGICLIPACVGRDGGNVATSFEARMPVSGELLFK